jgi:hypothetical protein
MFSLADRIIGPPGRKGNEERRPLVPPIGSNIPGALGILPSGEYCGEGEFFAGTEFSK